MINSVPSSDGLATVLQNSHQSSHSTMAKKSVMKALKMSVIHVVVFVVSWTPYTVMATW